MTCRELLKQKHRIVVKIGSSTLSYPNGKLNFQRIEELATVLSSLQEEGKKMLLVSSGAIAVGAGRFGIHKKPDDLSTRQAFAAVGQAGLIKIYQRFFDHHHHTVAQVLLTKDAVTSPTKRKYARNTLDSLMDLGVIPIINENDVISTEQIEFGDNDTLSAYVAELIEADLLIILSDIDGVYSADPRTDPNAKIIPFIERMSPELESLAEGSRSSFGTGGMVTKIGAAKICWSAGIDAVITNGSDARVIQRILNGEQVGTLFAFSGRMMAC